jgi:hypothetical protein
LKLIRTDAIGIMFNFINSLYRFQVEVKA